MTVHDGSAALLDHVEPATVMAGAPFPSIQTTKTQNLQCETSSNFSSFFSLLLLAHQFAAVKAACGPNSERATFFVTPKLQTTSTQTSNNAGFRGNLLRPLVKAFPSQRIVVRVHAVQVATGSYGRTPATYRRL
jgi:hypothetical protein